MKLKLSDAIRNGCGLSRQGFGNLFDGDKACALGASIEWLVYTGVWDRPKNSWDFFSVFQIAGNRTMTPCQCESTPSSRIDALIAHLNDYHRWSREAIAEWIETIEKLEETGDKGAEAGDEKVAPPPCSQEIKDCTPAEVSLTD